MTSLRPVRLFRIALALATVPAAATAQDLFDDEAAFTFGGIDTRS